MGLEARSSGTWFCGTLLPSGTFVMALVLRPLSPGTGGRGAGTEAAARSMFRKQRWVPKALCLSSEGSHLGNATPSETPSREQPVRRRLGDS